MEKITVMTTGEILIGNMRKSSGVPRLESVPIGVLIKVIKNNF